MTYIVLKDKDGTGDLSDVAGLETHSWHRSDEFWTTSCSLLFVGRDSMLFVLKGCRHFPGLLCSAQAFRIFKRFSEKLVWFAFRSNFVFSGDLLVHSLSYTQHNLLLSVAVSWPNISFFSFPVTTSLLQTLTQSVSSGAPVPESLHQPVAQRS